MLKIIKNTIFILSITILFTACEESKAVSQIQNAKRGSQEQLKKETQVTISFGSYGSGTNRLYSKKVAAYILSSKNIQAAHRLNWGKEGEHTFYLKTNKNSKVFSELKTLLPKESDSGSISLAEQGGKSLRIKNSRFN